MENITQNNKNTIFSNVLRTFRELYYKNIEQYYSVEEFSDLFDNKCYKGAKINHLRGLIFTMHYAHFLVRCEVLVDGKYVAKYRYNPNV